MPHLRRQKICYLTIASIILFSFFPISTKAQENPAATKDSIEELQEQIKAKSDQINEINQKIQYYEQEVESLRGQAANLKGHLQILDSQISMTENEIELVHDEIQQKELEIKKLNLDINETQQQIDQKLKEIETIIKEINSLDEDYLASSEIQADGVLDVVFHFFKVILKYSSWSEYEKTVEDTKTINEVLRQKREALKGLKANLEQNKSEVENKARELSEKQQELEKKNEFLAQEKDAKRQVLSETQANESKYEDLLEKAAAAQRALNQEVVVLKDEVRKKIASLQQPTQSINAILAWPIPFRRITAVFHDPSYPYRRYFEHPAIDIACPQGTPIYAPAAGYVARTRNAGYGYNYITLIHTENLQTRYGHVSAFAVNEGDFVKAGQIIGYSGGMPGTPGAGYLTTGPHLHFEVRLGTSKLDDATGAAVTFWESVNPLNYLP